MERVRTRLPRVSIEFRVESAIFASVAISWPFRLVKRQAIGQNPLPARRLLLTGNTFRMHPVSRESRGPLASGHFLGISERLNPVRVLPWQTTSPCPTTREIEVTSEAERIAGRKVPSDPLTTLTVLAGGFSSVIVAAPKTSVTCSTAKTKTTSEVRRASELSLRLFWVHS